VRFEYEAEDDAEPVRVVMRFARPGADGAAAATLFTAPAPAAGSAVSVRGVPHDVKATTWHVHPDSPELDWVEVILA
jgi:hypothetical protein